MSKRPSLDDGPNPSRREMVGFCWDCGRVLEPTDYLSCTKCYRREKQEKRRYARSTAQRQLACALERVGQLEREPLLCHWVPFAAILFGSMLNEDQVKVGDVDLCVLGSPAFLQGYASCDETRQWAAAHAPASMGFLRRLGYPKQAAYSFIRKGNTLLSLLLEGDFASVGGGRPFPYEVVWTAAGCDPGVLRADIEAARPRWLAKSINERQDSVSWVLGRKQR